MKRTRILRRGAALLLALTLLAAFAAWHLAGESAATAWEERREGGMDIGI